MEADAPGGTPAPRAMPTPAGTPAPVPMVPAPGAPRPVNGDRRTPDGRGVNHGHWTIDAPARTPMSAVPVGAIPVSTVPVAVTPAVAMPVAMVTPVTTLRTEFILIDTAQSVRFGRRGCRDRREQDQGRDNRKARKKSGHRCSPRLNRLLHRNLHVTRQRLTAPSSGRIAARPGRIRERPFSRAPSGSAFAA